MNCKGVIREISDYIDGELDLTLRQELERHLEHCEDCTLILDQTRKSIEILCDSEPIPLSPEVQSRLRAALREKLTQKPA